MSLQKFPSARLPKRERDAHGGEGAAAPVTRRPRDRGSPRPQQGVRRRSPGPDAGVWGLRGSLSAAPEPCTARRGRGPSRGAGLPRPLPGGSGQRGPSPQAESPRPERTEQRGRAAATASGVLERTPASRARPPRTHQASGPPARPSSPSTPAAAAPAAPWAAALGVGTGLGQGAGAGSRQAGVARRPASRQALTGPGAPGRAGWADRGEERGCRLR